MSDGTRPTPTVGGPTPGPPGGPSWQAIVIATLLGLILLLALILVLVRSGGDDGDVATDDSLVTTTSSSSSSTTASSSSTTSTTTTTTTTAPTTTVPTTTTTSTTPRATTTTSGPPATVLPARCTGLTGRARPDTVAEVFYEAWTLGDRQCAEQVATNQAVDQLFFFDGTDADWSFQGCVDDDDGEPTNCSFRYEGGSSTFRMRFDDVTGWEIFAVSFRAD